MPIGGLFAKLLLLKSQKNNTPCPRCNLLYDPKSKQGCPHCSHLDDHELASFLEHQKVARTERSSLGLTFWIVALILFLALLSSLTSMS